MLDEQCVENIEDEIEQLKQKIALKERQLQELRYQQNVNLMMAGEEADDDNSQLNSEGNLMIKSDTDKKLNNSEINRYSRQIILSEIGVKGQIKLKNSSILIVGAGGLGCPAALYLSGAGIGHLGIVDYDSVDLNNLHRQLLHTETSIGIPKTQSAKTSLLKLNSSTNITVHTLQLTSENALNIIENYNIVLDCTDNVATRYLLNDACVMLRKPLVSGSAIKFEGQLTVYNHLNGPCYRCIFPTPPPPESVTNCSDGGVIGAVPGVIGTLQALEAIKIILEFGDLLVARLLLFDGSSTMFRTVKLRTKRDNCNVCSEKPIITRLIDYELFCGMRASDKDFSLKILEDDERISVYDYDEMIQKQLPHLLIDVRTENEYEICHLATSVNIPLKIFLEDKDITVLSKYKKEGTPVFVICRRGNDSQLAVKHIQMASRGFICPKDIIGGLNAWAKYIDRSFPTY